MKNAPPLIPLPPARFPRAGTPGTCCLFTLNFLAIPQCECLCAFSLLDLDNCKPRSAPLTPNSPPFIQLHIFARTPNTDHADVEVGDKASVAELKRAVIAELKLDLAPHRVRLLREVDGQDPVPLDSLKKLTEQGLSEGSRVVAVVAREWAGSCASSFLSHTRVRADSPLSPCAEPRSSPVCQSQPRIVYVPHQGGV